MKRVALTMLTVAVAASPAFAQTGNGAPSGSHYSLNIIGVEKGKNPPLTGSERHTIFVALGTKGDPTGVESRIYLTPATEFQVCDGNAFDAAHDCSGQPIGNLQGAVFALPCNTNIESTNGETVFACDPADPKASYEVWARALGAPGGSAVITTCATDAETGLEVCSTENTLDVLVRKSGKSTFTNVTQELTSLVGCVSDPATDGVICGRFALFRDEFQDWFWSYANSGLRLAQLRFYKIN
jgi:hypothetical protein